MQKRLHSLLESLTNVAIGYSFAIGTQLCVFPLFDIDITMGDNILIGLIFTVVSIVRSYVLRRFFTRKTEKENKK